VTRRPSSSAIAGCARVALAVTLACAAFAVPESAEANGRFPAAYQLVVDPLDPARISVQVTYGMIHSFDAGASWSWTCEQAALYGGEYDPALQILGGGTTLIGTFDGLVVGSPDTCDYAFAAGELEGRYVVDVSSLKSDPAHAIAVSSDGLGGNEFDTRVWSTTDGAQSWSGDAAPLPTSFLALTLDAAPSDPSRLYVSGFDVQGPSDYVGTLARSDDGGATWSLLPIEGSTNTSGPFLAAVDPSDPDGLWLRLAGDAGRLLRSTDGGLSWSMVFQGTGRLTAFALSPDGSEVVVGSSVDGLHHATTSELVFTQRTVMDALCATWTPEALYLCTVEARSGFTIGRSLDGGTSFTPIHQLACLDGPPASCPASSDAVSQCVGPWAAQRQVLRVDTCETGAGGGSSSSTGAGGTGGSSGDDGANDGCCTVAPGAKAHERDVLVLGLAAVGFALAAARRRRR
jgi:hypothetical protein